MIVKLILLFIELNFRAPELYAFVAGEIARNCKRPASPLDVNMDVQSHSNKRQRFM